MDPSTDASIRQSLLVHNGELADVRAALESLGISFAERDGPLKPGDEAAAWELVVATPGRMLELALSGAAEAPARLVVADQDSRTLRTRLDKAGISLMVRRPVHPAALRGLILHALYRGPEKRRVPRVTVGAPITIRTGWRHSACILADLSVGGCRLIANQFVKPGKRVTLTVPAEVAGGRPYGIRAVTLRTTPIQGDELRGTHSIHARFDAPSQRKLNSIKQTLIAYRKGPAVYASSDEMVDDAAQPDPREAPRSTTMRISSAGTPPPERRDGARQEIEKRVVALDDEADRVLMGRDISPGGMRVSPSPYLTIGDDIKLAIHLAETGPLHVGARVHRDDGERGVVLRFHQLSPEASGALMNLMETTPVVVPGDPNGGGLIVSELLEVGSA